METTTHEVRTESKARGAAVNALAIVGFVALILLGMGLAIYAARFMPAALSGIGEAAVSLSSIFTPDNKEGGVEVVPPSDENAVTIPIGTSTPSTPATTPSTPPTGNAKPSTGGSHATYTPPAPQYRVITVPVASTWTGEPDLTVDIVAIGYLKRSGDIDSFVETDRIPNGKDGAVKFRVSNRGTNVSGRFDLEIQVKNGSGTDTDTVRGPALPPGTSVSSFATFDANRTGDVDIRLEADSGNDVDESDERNNTDSGDATVR